MNDSQIHIRGARVHNLKNVDLDIPKNELVCFTGVSGSGKSSMAFDTIYAEGQRRYVESLSAYARQFLDQMEKPDVDSISGLAPTISIEQKAAGRNPRSTVGTMTEVYDYLRVLFARLGTLHCTECGKPVGRQSQEQIIDRITDFPEGSRLSIMAPVVRGRQGEFVDLFEDLQKQGFVRARVDGEVVSLTENPGLARHMKHDIDVIVDRIIIRDDIRSRVAEAVQTALEAGEGTLIVNQTEGPDDSSVDTTMGTSNTCCGITYAEPTPQLFSFNVPAGMCPTCSGLGTHVRLDIDLLIPDHTLSPRQGAIATVNVDTNKWTRHYYEGVLKHFGDVDLDTPWERIPETARGKLLYGLDGERIRFIYGDRKPWTHKDTFGGIIPDLERRYREAKDDKTKEVYGKFMSQVVCPECEGTRLRKEARAVKLGGISLPELSAMPVDEAHRFLSDLELSEVDRTIGQDALLEILARLEFLLNVGLRYISLNRSAQTLSGGESQRIRLASQIGSGLVGVLYVLDEPSIGLHHRDNHRLLNALSRLRDMGNTVIVVEHDEDTMRAADRIVDFGPGPGIHGGEIVVNGGLDDVIGEARSITGQFLSGERTIPIPESRRSPNGAWLELRGARHNNLRNITVSIPLGMFTCVTGVSGSGKSSLISDTMLPVLDRHFYNSIRVPGEHDEVLGIEHLDKVIDIDQSPIGRTPRSNPATYTGVYTPIRKLFSDLPQSKLRGYEPGRFSFNVKEGRCDACDGNGAIKVEMDFLADVWVPCPVCDGARFNAETLQIKYKGKSIADVLDMDVQEALAFFENVPPVARILQTLRDVGLDYIKLGQPSPTLSGGEAQRVKLAKELCRRSTGKTVYVLDEPTTGLHFHDISHLLNVLHRFCDEGNTVVVIEHNMDVIKTADWIIDLGPEGGEDGGRLIAAGSPTEVAGNEKSWTGQVLKQVLATGRTGDLDPIRVQTPEGQDHVEHAALALDRDAYEPAERVTDISIVGAREHNLKGVSVKIPREKLVVFSGVSGSGKTSLALDTIYAEGQRRYVESLSAYARQFLGQVQKPRVDHVEGLSPAIAIEQRSAGRNPRSTVGTVTEIYDYLRVIFAQVADVYCPECQVKAVQQSASEVVDRLVAQFDGERIVLLAPVEPGRGEDYDTVLARAKRDGYLRARVDGEIGRIDDLAGVDKRRTHSIEIVIDRLEVKADDRGRLGESVEATFSRGAGRLAAVPADGGEELQVSQHLSCPSCGRSFERLSPQMFAFNRAHDAGASGMCPACQGLGTQQGLAEETVIPHPEKNIRQGAVTLWGRPEGQFLRMLTAAGKELGFDVDTPIRELDAGARDRLFYGVPNHWVEVKDGFSFQYLGLFPGIDRTLRAAPQVREALGQVLSDVPCGVCGGTRLLPVPRYARIPDGNSGSTIGRITNLPVSEAFRFFSELPLEATNRSVVGEVLDEIVNRLRFLDEVGLGYITLDRRAPTLSGGEAQRIRLASQIGSGLTGVLYVLDEPTIGLHPRDNRRLLGALDRLRDLNNTVIVVEHDTDTLNAADHIIDFGPGAGSSGGEIVGEGSPDVLAKSERSLTGRFLGGAEAMPVPEKRRPGSGMKLTVEGARQNNLKDIDAEFPLGTFTVVTGVSGSGKSTLLIDVLYKALAAKLHRASVVPGLHDRVRGIDHVDKIILIDQEPIGNSPQSNPATYSGVFDNFRQLYAQLPESKVRGYSARRFSTNVPGGRCERCWGYGQRHIEMHFLPDVWVECDECGGMRYNRETLEVKFDGKSVGDVLNMPVDEALEHFHRVPKIRQVLQTLVDVGLGYLELGRSAPTLSGGEAQRLKLARELSRPSTGQTVYIMDEPTTGLHFADTARLMAVIDRLVEGGNTVIVIEHNLGVMAAADWIVDLGPEGGEAGGEIVVAGTPEAVSKHKGSHTGGILREVLEKMPRERISLDEVDAFQTSTSTDEPDVEEVIDIPEPEPDVASGKPPWKIDGKAWHLNMDRPRRGGKPTWSAELYAFFVDELEAVDRMRTDWTNKFSTIVRPKDANGMIWAWVEDAFAQHVAVYVPVAPGAFTPDTLAEATGIIPVPEASTPSVYYHERRDTRHEVELSAGSIDQIDVEKFRAFLRKAYEGWMKEALPGWTYSRGEGDIELEAGEAVSERPPWRLDGERWHLDPERRRRDGRIAEWDTRAVGMLLEKLKALHPLRFTWTSQLFVSIKITHGTPVWARVHTHAWDSASAVFHTPSGAFDAATAQQFGVELIRTRRGLDYFERTIRTLADVEHEGFLSFIEKCHRAFAEQFGVELTPVDEIAAEEPWKSDGSGWHLDTARPRDGKAPVWEREALEWVLAQIEALGPVDVNWSNKNTVTVNPIHEGKKLRAWLRVSTDDWRYFRLSFRAPKSSFDGATLRRELGLRPFAEIPETPYKAKALSRVRMNGRKKDWTYVEILGLLSRELKTDAFVAFLRRCRADFEAASEKE